MPLSNRSTSTPLTRIGFALQTKSPNATPEAWAALRADVPRTFTTPEIRVDCPDDRKFAIVEAAARHFAARYAVNTIDGVRMTFADGWGLLRASNTQPVLVLRFEAASAASLAEHRREVETWLTAQGVGT